MNIYAIRMVYDDDKESLADIMTEIDRQGCMIFQVIYIPDVGHEIIYKVIK